MPPNCIRLKYSRIKQHLYIKEVLKPKISGWSPVIVVGELTPADVTEREPGREYWVGLSSEALTGWWCVLKWSSTQKVSA